LKSIMFAILSFADAYWWPFQNTCNGHSIVIRTRHRKELSTKWKDKRHVTATEYRFDRCPGSGNRLLLRSGWNAVVWSWVCFACLFACFACMRELSTRGTFVSCYEVAWRVCK
jgi:hypothetical protein